MSDTTGQMSSLSLRQALDAMETSALPILAGGTDFYPALRDAAAPAEVLDVTRITSLRQISETAEGWSIGAASTWTDVINTDLPPVFDALKAAAREVGSVQIQNSATLAGNLCNASPAADGVPPLLTLNATVELASSRGHRIMPLSEFITGPRMTERAADELLIAIHVPRMSEHARSRFFKLGSRRYLVISIVMASVTLVADEQGNLVDVRIAVGSCSAVARRLVGLEQVLTGQSIRFDIVSLVSSGMLGELAPIDDVRGSGQYRMDAVQKIVSRLLSDTVHDIEKDRAAGVAQGAWQSIPGDRI